ncbi:MAG TPA: NrfD/PsrC family molybdoenzyme membrane anchor subunit, partial [Chloroflexota bacterium]|nr:NrfD/PsrC family molybdoenzyme membrane anchor subunit [Chloroflexota bacterium]
FLGGLVAGLMIVGGLLAARGRDGAWTMVQRAADLAGLPLLGLGMLLLWLDLANGWNAHRFYLTLQVTSPMSWGSWVLLLCFAVLGARFAHTGSQLALKRPVLPKRLGAGIGYASFVLGLALGTYTGLLLGTIGARPLWSTPVLPALFLASGLGAGLAFLAPFARGALRRRLLPFTVGVALAELLALGTYLLVLDRGSDAARTGVAVLLGGEYTAAFWLLVVFGGLIVPVGGEVAELLLHRAARVGASVRGAGAAALERSAPLVLAALTLLGSLTLRWVIVYGGQLTGI